MHHLKRSKTKPVGLKHALEYKIQDIVIKKRLKQHGKRENLDTTMLYNVIQLGCLYSCLQIVTLQEKSF